MSQPAPRLSESPKVEERIAKIEAHVQHTQTDTAEIKGDLRRIDARLATKAEAEDASRRFDAVDSRFEKVDSRFDKLEAKVDTNASAEEVDRRFDAVDRRLDAVDRRFDKLDEKIDRIFLWLLGAYGAGVVLTLGFVYFIVTSVVEA
jgi:chromosome segregation ATPase